MKWTRLKKRASMPYDDDCGIEDEARGLILENLRFYAEGEDEPEIEKILRFLFGNNLPSREEVAKYLATQKW